MPTSDVDHLAGQVSGLQLVCNLLLGEVPEKRKSMLLVALDSAASASEISASVREEVADARAPAFTAGMAESIRGVISGVPVRPGCP